MSFQVERMETIGSNSSTKFHFFLVVLSWNNGSRMNSVFLLAHCTRALKNSEYGTTLVSGRPLDPGSKLAHVRSACWRG